MTDQRHSPEPWSVQRISRNHRLITTIRDADGNRVDEDVAVKRVNALAGLDPERVRELVEAADILRRDYAQRDAGSIPSKRLRCDVERVLAALSRLEGKS